MKTRSCESFVRESSKTHGNKYNYDLVEYKNNKTKIKIICPTHGMFLQRAGSHLSGGQGCKKCSMKEVGKQALLTQEEFLSRARKAHGSKYNYDLAEYKNNVSKIKIICPRHGSFSQRPNNHFNGYGCHKCGIENQTLSQKQFLSRAKDTHGEKYDYSLSIYKTNHAKMKIICPKHGVFLQAPAQHLRGHGCPKCGGVGRPTLNEFIFSANVKHNNRYDYSKVLYTNNRIKVKIICRIHGEFFQSPNLHLRGSGCPKCNISKGEARVKNYLDKNGFCYEQQHTFDSCVYKRRLPFDFSVKLKNKICLIEYHGQQHYELVNFTSRPDRAAMKFEQTQRNDKIKQKWCQSNNVPLLTISYLEESKIDEVLDSFFAGKQK